MDEDEKIDLIKVRFLVDYSNRKAGDIGEFSVDNAYLMVVKQGIAEYSDPIITPQSKRLKQTKLDNENPES